MDPIVTGALIVVGALVLIRTLSPATAPSSTTHPAPAKPTDAKPGTLPVPAGVQGAIQRLGGSAATAFQQNGQSENAAYAQAAAAGAPAAVGALAGLTGALAKAFGSDDKPAAPAPKPKADDGIPNTDWFASVDEEAVGTTDEIAPDSANPDLSGVPYGGGVAAGFVAAPDPDLVAAAGFSGGSANVAPLELGSEWDYAPFPDVIEDAPESNWASED